MLVAHDGENRAEESHSETTSAGGEHVGHTQAATTEQVVSSDSNSSQGMVIGGGIALVVLAAVVLIWSRSRKKPAEVSIETAETSSE